MHTKKNRINIKTISELTGVVPSTVSRILNGKSREYRISEETEKRVLAKADELGFRPNYFAHSLNTGRTFNIGLIMANRIDSFLGSIIEGVEASLRNTEYQMVLATCENDSALEMHELQRMLYRQVDGIIVYPSESGKHRIRQVSALQGVREKGKPLVIIGRNPGVAADTILFADFQMGVTAAEYFLSCGCRFYGVIERPQAPKEDCLRIEGHIYKLRDAGVPDERIVRIRQDELVAQTPVPEAWLKIDCLWGINSGAVLEGAQQFAHFRKPGSLRLCGLGQERFTELMPFDIRMFPLPAREMGVRAATLLLEQMNFPALPDPRTILLT